MLNKYPIEGFITEILFVLLISATALLFYFYQYDNGIAFCILVLFIKGLIFVINDGIGRNITILSFFITYFTFLLSRIIFPLFFNTDKLALQLGETTFNHEIDLFVNFALFVSLLFVYIGYRLVRKTENNNMTSNVKRYYEYKSVIRVQNFTKNASIFFSIFSILGVIDQIRYVFSHGYMNFYLNYQTAIPYPIIFLGTFFEYFAMFYLATMPSKKEAMPIILLYLFVNIMSLGMGQRGSAVLSIIFIISYFFIRNNTNPGPKPWIGRKGIISIALSIPILITILFFTAYVRTEKEVDPDETANILVSFFYQQGVSVNVLGYANKFYDILPDGKLYSAGKVIDFFVHNSISQILFDTEPVKPQTMEHALNDHTLHAALTYYGSPSLYFSGGGYGGCYVADLWVDFGFLGIIIGSLIYGLVLAKIRKWCGSSFWKTSLGLMMYTKILFAPRANFIDFVYVFVPFTAVIAFAVIFIVKNMPIENHEQYSDFSNSKAIGCKANS